MPAKMKASTVVAGGSGIAAGRRIAERFSLRDTCMLLRPRTIDDGAGGSEPDPDGPEAIGPLACSFLAVSGDEATADLIAERGRYRVYLAVDLRHPETGDALELASSDQVTVLGTTYDVVWTPPPHALALLRTVGLKE